MTLGLLTLHLLSVAAIAVTVFYGIHIPEGGGAFGRHFIFALIASMLAVFTHTMTYFYFVGMGSNLKRAVEEHGRGRDRLSSSRVLKAKVLPWAFGGMALLMATFILGGGAHTRAIPSWIHSGLGYLSLGYSFVALLVEGYFLLQQNRLVNAFQRELVGVRERNAEIS
ncbi:MAG TPA: hypothetical protein VEK15_07535 [Vicinamibacteria bacterium]|nr:hypothetical protein [Vicinamibacteria bacterium]